MATLVMMTLLQWQGRNRAAISIIPDLNCSS